MILSSRLYSITLTVLLSSALLACGGGGTSSSTSSSSSSGGGSQALSLSPITQSSTSARTTSGTVVIKDQAALTTNLNAHFGVPDSSNMGLPSVDFSRQTVFAIFSGTAASPCHSVQIESVSQQSSGKILVTYREIAPPPSTICTANLGSPMDMVAANIPAQVVTDVEFRAAESATRVGQYTVDTGDSPGIKYALNVLSTNTSNFNTLIKAHLAEGAGRAINVSTLDFTKRSVVGVFLGNQLCTQAQIDNVSLTKSGTLSVKYRQIQAAPGTCQSATPNSPMHLVTVDVAPSAIKEIVFNGQSSNTLIPFSVRDYNLLSNVSLQSFETITDQQAANEAWNRLNGNRQTLLNPMLQPPIDFSKTTVGALFYGDSPSSCTQIHTLRVETAGKNATGQTRLNVSYADQSQMGPCLTVITTPAELITIPIGNAELSFNKIH